MAGSNATILAIPEGVEEIGALAFADCRQLHMVFLPSTLKKISITAFDGCSELSTVQVPTNAIKVLNRMSFCNMMDVIVRDDKGKVGKAAFSGNKHVRSVAINEPINGIGEEAFQGCSEMQRLSVPASVKTVGNLCLEGCGKLNELYVHWTAQLPEAELGQAPYDTCVLYVPAGTKALYAASPTWGKFKHIEEE